MTGIRLPALLTMACLACTSKAATRAMKLGVVAGFPDGRLCLAVPDSSLTVGQRLLIAFIPLVGDSTPTAQGAVEVTARAASLCAGLWGDYDWADYLVSQVQEPTPSYGRGPAVALVGGEATFITRNGELQADLDGDGTLEVFRSCTSNEGLHLTAWSGPPLKSRRIWHHYFALHYDVEPSCTPADYEER